MSEVVSALEQGAPVTESHVGFSRPRVILVGPPGSGKSTIGRRLARALNVPLTDTDDVLAQENNMACGALFSSVGEERFRELEATVVARALNHGGVVSLGGGAVVTPATRELLRDHPVVWIDVGAEEGVRRTSGSSTRPVLEAADPLQHYREILTTREPFYREVSDYRVRSDMHAPGKLVADILSFLESL